MTFNTRHVLYQLRKRHNLRNMKRNFSSNKPALVLGIETSCDDTGCAIVDSTGKILGEALRSQESMHLKYGGIIPSIAQYEHKVNITDICERALRAANLRLRDIDAIATTVQPGLPLSLAVGKEFGKYLSNISNKPFIPIHHMQAHALTARMVEKVDFPYLTLLISGGHCLLAIVENVDKFYLLGSSLDDAPGESFDKMARKMKLHMIPEYAKLNGGQAIEAAASKATNPEQFSFPQSLAHVRSCNFSFSGLKNAFFMRMKSQERIHNVDGGNIIPDAENLCAGFLVAITQHLAVRTQRAMEFIKKRKLFPGEHTLVVSGGVACNNFIAKAMDAVCSDMGFKFVRPPPKLCTDNGIMIAWNGIERWTANKGVLYEQNEIQQIDIQNKCPIGEDWSLEVQNESIKCQWTKIRFKDINSRICT